MVSERSESRPFDILGISEVEENAYRWLLAHPGASVPETARALGLTPGKTQGLLDAIEAKSLVTHSPERPRRYIPASPEMAIEALVLQYQNDLQRVRSVAGELQKEMDSARVGNEREQVVELITSHETERQTYNRMHQLAHHEIVTLIRPPLWISRLDRPSEHDQRYQREAQARGVHYRSVIDTDFIALPGAAERVRDDIRAGEKVRTVSHLPFKMVLTDRRLAFVPLHLHEPDSTSLLVRSSALLDALYALFEVFWKGAAPVSFNDSSALGSDGSFDTRSARESEDLIALMTAGLNDKKIASELEISESTLTRRIAALMRSFNARTRFQLACLITQSSSGRDPK